MKEIGGYLELEHYDQEEYYNGFFRLNTVRNAIALIMKEYGYKKLYIPKYLCHSVRKMLQKYGYDFEFYTIDETMAPAFNKILKRDEAILIVNYYGQFSNTALDYFRNQYHNIIVDNTQAFFQKPCEDIDTVYTCRKYFGVADGAYLSLAIPSIYYNSLPEDHSYTRMLHLLGRYENSASEFYQYFQMVDEKFENEEIKKMSSLTRNLLKSVNYQTVIEKRRANVKYLHSHLQSQNTYKVNVEGCLYMYPFLIKNGNELREQLIKKKIYIPTLWPNVLKECNTDSFEYYLAENLVLLPIDQRYTPSDMEYILNQFN